MGYIYSLLWFVTAYILFFRFRKESAVIYILCLYFVFLGVWWLVNQFTSTDMMNGVYGWTLRIVSVGVLAAGGVTYHFEKNRKAKQEQEKIQNNE